MIDSYEVYLKEILQMEIFESAEVVAGHSGLNRRVKWSHILETEAFETLVNGYELILTTSSRMSLDQPEGIEVIKALIEKKVSGICIELGTHIQNLSPEVIAYAQKHNFPLIVFKNFVKFITITQGIHTKLMEKQHKMLQTINYISRTFNELSLQPNGVIKILEKLYDVIGGEVYYRAYDNRDAYYPPELKREAAFYDKLIFEKLKNKNDVQMLDLNQGCFRTMSVKSSGITWGQLCLEDDRIKNDDFVLPIMYQASLAIAQIMLRNRTIEERKRNEEDKMVRDMVYGRGNAALQMREVFTLDQSHLTYRLMIFQKKAYPLESKYESWDEVQLQQTMLLRTLFKREGIKTAISVRENDIILILLLKNKNDKQVLKDLLDSLPTVASKLFNGHAFLTGLSSKKSDTSQIENCYHEAQSVITLKQKEMVKTSDFYEELGIYRILLHEVNQLQSFVTDYLQVLIDYDKEMGTDLVYTLEIYYDYNLSKKETAEKLFIARQSLYHRIDKIESLLGYDISQTTYRLSLEVALKARHLL